MNKLICPKCQIPNFYLKSINGGDILPVYITLEGEIALKRDGDSLDGYDTDVIFCFGCSWSGSIATIMKKR